MGQEELMQLTKELSDEDMAALIRFAQFLKSDSNVNRMLDAEGNSAVGKCYRTPGGFSGPVIMSDDFFETPECFEGYV